MAVREIHRVCGYLGDCNHLKFSIQQSAKEREKEREKKEKKERGKERKSEHGGGERNRWVDRGVREGGGERKIETVKRRAPIDLRGR